MRSEREKAWAALSANALLLPGSGSLYLGHRLSGTVQATLSLLGFALSMMWIVRVARQWMADGMASFYPPPHLEMGLLGLGLFAVGWVWGLLTAWDALRRAGGRPSPPPRPR